METTKLLPELIEALWARHVWATGCDPASILRLRAPSGDELHIERSQAPRTVRIRYYLAAASAEAILDLEVLLLKERPGEWAPLEFCRARTGHHVYARMDDDGKGVIVLDPDNQAACARYCDGWAFALREQGWLEQGVAI
ncbi:hypothetical protein LCGC14_1708730 [marine sediment metagenome]|uniref:Uncharacterized protein n=1 Tax=marine sediment metagenome TaxID=412755 RepID=A0A0F9HGC8_9ZZZZ